jgi:hypothetical protein
MGSAGFEVGRRMDGLAMRVEGVVCTFGSVFSWLTDWLMDFHMVSCLFLATTRRQSSSTLLTRAINSVCEGSALRWLSLILRLGFILFIVFYLTVVKPPLSSKSTLTLIP